MWFHSTHWVPSLHTACKVRYWCARWTDKDGAVQDPQVDYSASSHSFGVSQNNPRIHRCFPALVYDGRIPDLLPLPSWTCPPVYSWIFSHECRRRNSNLQWVYGSLAVSKGPLCMRSLRHGICCRRTLPHSYQLLWTIPFRWFQNRWRCDLHWHLHKGGPAHMHTNSQSIKTWATWMNTIEQWLLTAHLSVDVALHSTLMHPCSIQLIHQLFNICSTD